MLHFSTERAASRAALPAAHSSVQHMHEQLLTARLDVLNRAECQSRTFLAKAQYMQASSSLWLGIQTAAPALLAGVCGAGAHSRSQCHRGQASRQQPSEADTHLGTQVATSAAAGFLLLRRGEVDTKPVSHGRGLRCRWGPKLYSSIRLCRW